MARVRLLALIALSLAALALAGCSGGETSSPAGEDTTAAEPSPAPEEPSPEPEPAPEPAPPEAESATVPEEAPTGKGNQPGKGKMRVQVWLAHEGKLFLASRDVAREPRVARAALRALLEGPKPFEETAEIGTAIPDGVVVRNVTLKNGVATVSLAQRFVFGGDEASLRLRLAQVVYTATQFPTIQKVRIELDGEPVEALGGVVRVDRPIGRKALAAELPPILVEEPQPSWRVSSPLRLRGSADVFEANVNVRVLDEQGQVVGVGHLTATCGTGCRGDFDGTIEFDVDDEQAGVVELAADDASDTGTRPGLVRVPVVLTP